MKSSNFMEHKLDIFAVVLLQFRFTTFTTRDEEIAS